MSNQEKQECNEREKRIEEQARNTYNDSLSGKIENQNHEHNARKEGFSRKEQNRNS